MERKPKGWNTIYVDIMVNGEFYRQMSYLYNPLFHIDLNDVEHKVLDKYPYLKDKKVKIELSNQRLFK